jgi:hypothetical protein
MQVKNSENRLRETKRSPMAMRILKVRLAFLKTAVLA